MAKKSNSDQKAQTLARIKRTEAYAERIRALFAATVNEILALNKTLPTLNEGEMFSFDNVSLKKQREVERLLRQLHSVATMAIQQGVKLEWAQANAECDKLVRSLFGKRVLETPEFTAWTQRNEAAMSAFLARSEKGLNLSQRVWKSCRQLRDEMEVAITVAVGDGTSAATMSRNVRKYLNDPDLMFRRFRYKAGEEIEYDADGNEIGKKIIWGKKWKKKIKKSDGSVGWIDYDKDSYRDEWTGSGYYKSSAQNAMRVARTETNVAYRRADQQRWSQMDFVLGQRINLSRSHPKKDICDKLAGDYPKEFVFDGWHPQCFCFVTPILMDENEILKMNEAMLRGEEYKPRGKRITQYPENFKQWVRDNEERITAAHDGGTDPYFVRNNFNVVQDILNPKKQLTPLEIAQRRHDARTPEQEEAIKLRWQERQQHIEAKKQAAEAERLRVQRINNTANNVLKTATTRFADFGLDTVVLEVAIKSGDTAIINAETRALAQVMAKKQQQIKMTANNVIGVASKYKDIGSSADAVTSLTDLLKTGNVSAINAETRALAQRVVALKQQLKSMSSVIPNAPQWSDQFTIAELQAAHDSIQSTIDYWKSKYGASLETGTNLNKLESELINKIAFVENPGKFKIGATQSTTWKVKQSAYMQMLAEVRHKLLYIELTSKLNVLKVYLAAHPKATTLLAKVQAVEVSLSNDDLSLAQVQIADAEKQKQILENAAARRAAKKGAKALSSSDIELVTTDKDAYSQKRKDNAVWCKSKSESDAMWGDDCDKLWNSSTSDEQKAWYAYTAGSGPFNRPLRGYRGGWGWKRYVGLGKTTLNDEGAEQKIRDFNALLKKQSTAVDMWIQRGIETWDGVEGFFGKKGLSRADLRRMVGQLVTDWAFMSCGSAKGTGFSGLILNIYIPKGAQAFYGARHSAYKHENETFIQLGATYRITKVEAPDYGNCYVDLELIGYKQHPLL